MRIHIVRHGQTSWNVEMRAQGHRDIDLDAEGERQANLLVSAFEDIRLDRIICSDLKRALRTAGPVSAMTGIEIERRSDLRERSYGSWEGVQFHKFIHQMTDAQRENYHDYANFRPPNGESFVDIWSRLEKVYADLITEHRDTLVVTHGGTGSVLVAKLIEANVLSARAFRFGNTGITTLIRRPDGHFALVRYNDQSHLDRRKSIDISGLVEVAK